jgi:hypothetical protein
MASGTDIPVDALVQSFLTALKNQQAAGLVIYGFVENGQSVVRLASNSDERGTQGILAFLQKTDENAIEEAAKAVHEAMKLIPGPWVTVPGPIKDKIRAGIKVALETVRAHSGKTLNIKTADDKPLIV